MKVVNNALINPEYHNRRLNEARCKLFHARDIWDVSSLVLLPALEDCKVYKCRVVYGKKIESIEIIPYHLKPIRTLKLVECDDISYEHKYLDRSKLDNLKLENQQTDDIIVVQDDRITDCSYANLVFFDGENWITPADPLLKGTKRQKYLEGKVIREDEIKVSDLHLFTKARIINAMIDLEESFDIEMDNIF